MKKQFQFWTNTLRTLGFRYVHRDSPQQHAEYRFETEILEPRNMLAGGGGTIAFAVGGTYLLNDTGTSAVDLITSDARVTGSVTGTQPATGTSRIQFDHYGDGSINNVQTVTVGGSFTYNPKTTDPSVTNSTGTFQLKFRAVEYNASNQPALYGSWQTLTYTLQADPVSAIRVFDGSSQEVLDDSIVQLPNVIQGNSVDISFRIDNTGNANLLLDQGSIAASPGLSFTSLFVNSVGPNSSTTLAMQLSASDIGSYLGQVSFATNDSAHTIFSFYVTANILPPPPESGPTDDGSSSTTTNASAIFGIPALALVTGVSGAQAWNHADLLDQFQPDFTGVPSIPSTQTTVIDVNESNDDAMGGHYTRVGTIETSVTMYGTINSETGYWTYHETVTLEFSVTTTYASNPAFTESSVFWVAIQTGDQTRTYDGFRTASGVHFETVTSGTLSSGITYESEWDFADVFITKPLSNAGSRSYTATMSDSNSETYTADIVPVSDGLVLTYTAHGGGAGAYSSTGSGSFSASMDPDDHTSFNSSTSWTDDSSGDYSYGHAGGGSYSLSASGVRSNYSGLDVALGDSSSTWTVGWFADLTYSQLYAYVATEVDISSEYWIGGEKNLNHLDMSVEQDAFGFGVETGSGSSHFDLTTTIHSDGSKTMVLEETGSASGIGISHIDDSLVYHRDAGHADMTSLINDYSDSFEADTDSIWGVGYSLDSTTVVSVNGDELSFDYDLTEVGLGSETLTITGSSFSAEGKSSDFTNGPHHTVGSNTKMDSVDFDSTETVTFGSLDTSSFHDGVLILDSGTTGHVTGSSDIVRYDSLHMVSNISRLDNGDYLNFDGTEFGDSTEHSDTSYDFTQANRIEFNETAAATSEGMTYLLSKLNGTSNGESDPSTGDPEPQPDPIIYTGSDSQNGTTNRTLISHRQGDSTNNYRITSGTGVATISDSTEWSSDLDNTGSDVFDNQNTLSAGGTMEMVVDETINDTTTMTLDSTSTHDSSFSGGFFGQTETVHSTNTTNEEGTLVSNRTNDTTTQFAINPYQAEEGVGEEPDGEGSPSDFQNDEGSNGISGLTITGSVSESVSLDSESHTVIHVETDMSNWEFSGEVTRVDIDQTIDSTIDASGLDSHSETVTYNADGSKSIVIDTSIDRQSDSITTGTGSLHIIGVTPDESIQPTHSLVSNHQFSNSNGTSHSETVGGGHVDITIDAEGNEIWCGGGGATTTANGHVNWHGHGTLAVGGIISYTRAHLVNTYDSYDGTSTSSLTYAEDGTPTETIVTANHVTGYFRGDKVFLSSVAWRHYWIDQSYDRTVAYLGFARGAYAPTGMPEPEGSESTPVALTMSNGSEGGLASIGEGGATGASGSTNGEMEVIESTNVMEWINENHFRNSLFGVVNVIAGAGEIALGVFTSGFGGWVLIAHGVDTTATGFYEVATGETSRTFTHYFFQNAFASVGMDEQTAYYGGLIVDLGIPFVVGGLLAAKSAPKLAALFGTRAAGVAASTVDDVVRGIGRNADVATELATRAAARGRMSGGAQEIGTRAHTIFARLNDRLNRRLVGEGSSIRVVTEEFRDALGNVVGIRALGSIGADVRVFSLTDPSVNLIFDLKTSGGLFQPISAARQLQFFQRFGTNAIELFRRR